MLRVTTQNTVYRLAGIYGPTGPGVICTVYKEVGDHLHCLGDSTLASKVELDQPFSFCLMERDGWAVYTTSVIKAVERMA